MIDRRPFPALGRVGSRPGAALRVILAIAAAGALVAPACAARSAAPASTPLGASPARGRAVGALQHDITAVLDADPFARTTWAVLISSLDRGDVFYARDTRRLVMPASNMKILTVAAAAETLGWDHRFETTVLATGPIAGGILAGDLIVTGGGDPSINGRGDAAARVFDEWAQRLREAGIRRIAGRIIGDGRAFPGDPLGQGWSWDYLGLGYAAPVSALQVNENLAELVITPAPAAGEAATVTVRPPESALQVAPRVRTAAAGSPAELDIQRDATASLVVVSGSVPAGGGEVVRSVAVVDPVLYFAGTLRRALIDRGLEVGGAADVIDRATPKPDLAGARPVFTHRSPPLGDLAVVLMTVSQNLYAETFLRAMGRARGAGTAADGRKAVAAALTSWGVPADAFIVADGSGLSRYNYVSAEAIVRILTHMHRDPALRDAFVRTLPVAGRGGGTIAGRMKGTAAEGNVAAKTGSIANVRALSGFLTTTSGERIVFSILANSFSVPQSTVDEAIDKVVVKLAEFKR